MQNVGTWLTVTGSLTSFAGMMATFVIFEYAAQWIKPDFMGNGVFYAYAGDLILFCLSLLAAAYVIVKTIDSSNHTTVGFFYMWRGGSFLGDWMGMFEWIVVMMHLTWGFMVFFCGTLYAESIFGMITDMLDEHHGSVGDPKQLTLEQGYKIFALSTMIGFGAWVGAITLGDSSAQLIQFFDNYNTKLEGTAYKATEADPEGTALTMDLSYHMTTTIVNMIVASFITGGAFAFGGMWLDKYGSSPMNYLF